MGGQVAQAVLLRQLANLANLAKAVYDMHRADQDARRAAQIERAIRRDLATVSARLPDPGPGGHPATKAAEAVRTARQAQAGPQRPIGSPVPRDLDPQRPRTTTTSKPGPSWDGIDR